MNHSMEVGIFWIGVNPSDLGCWRLTLNVGQPMKIICGSPFFIKLSVG